MYIIPTYLFKSGLADAVVSDAQPLFIALQMAEHGGPGIALAGQLVHHWALCVL